MNAGAYVHVRQRLWAQRKRIALVPASASSKEQAEPSRTAKLRDNLFEPLSKDAESEIRAGDGGELKGHPCRMQSLHSSTALACNMFHHWRTTGALSVIAEACGVPSRNIARLRFEAKLPIADAVDRNVFPQDPNIDVLLEYSPHARISAVGIECKFGEAYGNHKGLKDAYLTSGGLWNGLPNCRKLAIGLREDDGIYKYLHAAQLLKHMLGLKNAYGQDKFRLMYLWYDVPSAEGGVHRQEIEQFRSVLKADGIHFQSATHQEVLVAMAKRGRENDAPFLDYMAERYL